jgi:hypothetical protein
MRDSVFDETYKVERSTTQHVTFDWRTHISILTGSDSAGCILSPFRRGNLYQLWQCHLVGRLEISFHSSYMNFKCSYMMGETREWSNISSCMAITMTSLACVFVQTYSGLSRPCSSQQYLDYCVCGHLVCDFLQYHIQKFTDFQISHRNTFRKCRLYLSRTGCWRYIITPYVKILVCSTGRSTRPECG